MQFYTSKISKFFCFKAKRIDNSWCCSALSTLYQAARETENNKHNTNNNFNIFCCYDGVHEREEQRRTILISFSFYFSNPNINTPHNIHIVIGKLFLLKYLLKKKDCRFYINSIFKINNKNIIYNMHNESMKNSLDMHLTFFLPRVSIFNLNPK